MTNRERSIVMWSPIVVFVMQRCLLSQSSFAICSGEFVTKIFNFKLFSFCLMVKVAKRLHVLLPKICFVLTVFR